MGTEEAGESYTCSVCGDSVAPQASAACNWCDQRYHLNPRNDAEGKDCGQVWIDEQYMALQFACDNCLKADGPQPPLARDPDASISRMPGRPKRARLMVRRHYKRRA